MRLTFITGELSHKLDPPVPKILPLFSRKSSSNAKLYSIFLHDQSSECGSTEL
jgi:hypothetical protein